MIASNTEVDAIRGSAFCRMPAYAGPCVVKGRVMGRLLLTVGTIIGVAGPALAQVSEEWARCLNENGAYSLDVAIAACTAVINSGKETQAILAIAYSNRGYAHDSKGDKDRAIDDYSNAIRLSPMDADFYNNRGVAYRSKGDNHRAIDD